MHTDEESISQPQTAPRPVRYNQRELVYLASYSVAANDTLMAHLETLGDEFGRPVGISRVAFGSHDAQQRIATPPESDQHICATILILEKAGLGDPDYRQFAMFCTRR